MFLLVFFANCKVIIKTSAAQPTLNQPPVKAPKADTILPLAPRFISSQTLAFLPSLSSWGT